MVEQKTSKSMVMYKVGSAELICIFGIVFEPLLAKCWMLLSPKRAQSGYFRPSGRAEWDSMIQNHSQFRKRG